MDELVNWLDDFDEPLEQNALDIKEDIINSISECEDYSSDFADADDKTQEANLLGLLEALKERPSISKDKKHLTLTLKYGDDHELMMMINNNTLKAIARLILVLQGKLQDTTADFTDSEYAILMAFMRLKGFSLEWFKLQRPDKAGGYFPYYNTSDLNLSIFGIYHDASEVDYRDNCFITAAINSNLFTPDEIDFIRSLIFTRYLPRDDLKQLAELLNVGIQISFYNPERKKIDKAVKYNQQAERQLRLLLRCGHYMLYHDELVPPNKYDVKNLNTLITRMIESNELQLIPDFSIAEKFLTYEYEYDTLEYPATSIKPIFVKEIKEDFHLILPSLINDDKLISSKCGSIPLHQLFDKLPHKTLIYLPALSENMIPIRSDYNIIPTLYRKTIQQIKIYAKNNSKIITLRNFHSLTSINYEGNDINEFTTIISKVQQVLHDMFGINLNDYSTLPKIAFASAFKSGCFNGVYSVSGIIQSFTKRCIHGGLVKTLHDHCFETSDVSCLDINSSYGTSMRDIPGLPKGKPKPFYNIVPPDSCYSFLQVNISNITEDKLGRFTFLHEGINFIDSILLEEIRKYITCDIEIINGYYYNEGFNPRIKQLSQKLYQLRSIEGLNKFGKNLLSSLYGKSLQSSQNFKIKYIPGYELNNFIALNGNYIYQISKNNRTRIYTVQMLKSINLNFNIPCFGVAVLSESRRRLNNIINYCNSNDIPIYAIKTDSFVIPTKDIDKITVINKIGSELGDFKIEYQAKHIKFTSSSCYRAELIDGSIRTRGNVQ